MSEKLSSAGGDLERDRGVATRETVPGNPAVDPVTIGLFGKIRPTPAIGEWDAREGWAVTPDCPDAAIHATVTSCGLRTRLECARLRRGGVLDWRTGDLRVRRLRIGS